MDCYFSDFLNDFVIFIGNAGCYPREVCNAQSGANFHLLTVFVLACFVGYYVIWKVTPALHAPLMSVTNAISSVIVVGAIFAATQSFCPQAKWCGFAAVVLVSINIFGGFMVTHRMLSMFRKK
ncbi:MAG: NAD(P) transhydrogenase subunit alpha [Holosporaceae bacterium]|jgi:NAD(P) transhydrogenase subunit alpha|nr:NAD(P) transhydrogenase subunit alpha [Holosporaceae bacterium]